MTRIAWLILICGALIAFVWEVYQMPFFLADNLSPYERTVRCGIASLGDGLILLTAYGLAAMKGGRHWPWRSPGIPYAIYFAFGLAVAIAVEMIATALPPESVLSWRYSGMMPVEPVTGLALVPLAMWVIVPALTLALVRFSGPDAD